MDPYWKGNWQLTSKFLLNSAIVFNYVAGREILKVVPVPNSECQTTISSEISKRIMCLPLYVGLEENALRKICALINSTIEKFKETGSQIHCQFFKPSTTL